MPTRILVVEDDQDIAQLVARYLEKAGFAEVYNVLEGFEGPLDENRHRGTLGGWRNAGLPWEQT